MNINNKKEANQVELKAQRFTSHTEIACTSFCHLKSYYAHHYGGTGIHRSMLPAKMFGGIVYHDLVGCKSEEETPKASWKDENKPETWGVDGLMVRAVNDETGDLSVFSLNRLVERVRAVHTTIINKQGMNGNLDEQLALSEAQFWVFHRIRFPELLKEFKIEAVEAEYTIELDKNTVLGVKADCVLRSRADEQLMAGEQKTTGNWKDQYFEGWSYSAQTAIECLGISNQFKEPCETVVMEFLNKGRMSNDQSTSPLVRFYSNGKEESHIRNTKKGWEARKVWEEKNIREWIYSLPIEVLANHHKTMKVHRKQSDCDRWLEVTRNKERRKSDALMGGEGSNAWKEFFEGRYDVGCYSDQYSHKCPYFDICYSPGENKETDPQDLLIGNEFTKREPHYKLERELLSLR